MKRILMAMVFLAGCTIEEEDFPAVYGDAVCDRIEECDLSAYEQLYSDDEDCESDWAAAAELLMDAADLLGGVYSEDEAKDCISEIDEAACSEFTSEFACNVYE